jgi:hypothetical protein
MTDSRIIKPVSELLWQPILEAAAQTLTGMVGAYIIGKVVGLIHRQNYFRGPQDLWFRGIIGNKVREEDNVVVDGLISTFTQVFPGNPFDNAKRWSALYHVKGKIDSQSFQSLDFVAGSDAALRVGSIDGESIIGIYDQYGYVGEGLIGIIATSELRKVFPNFNDPLFIGARAVVYGKLRKCPSQHAYVIESISRKAGLKIDVSGYKHLYYLNINRIEPYKQSKNIFTLLGSPWATTADKENQYIIRYAHLSNLEEKTASIEDMKRERAWKNARVFYDDLEAPSDELRFKKNFF